MTQLISKNNQTFNLRPPQETDIPALYQYALDLGNEDTFVLLNPQEPVTMTEEKEVVKRWIKDIQSNDLILYLVFDHQRLIGISQISRGNRRQRDHGHFGISLHQDYRHLGIGSQLGKLIIHEAITKMNLRLIRLEVFESNQVAINMYQKLGFKEYGRLPQAFKFNGQLETEIMMYYLVV